MLDPYRVEGLLRSTPPGRQNVPILGNSVAEFGFDVAVLEQRFAAADLRFPKLTIGGAPALTFGMMADDVVALKPRAVILLVTAPSLRSRGYLDHVYTYDVDAAAELFTPEEALSEPRFHLHGVLRQLNVFARHRSSLQRALLVQTGHMEWADLHSHVKRIRIRHMMDGSDAWQTWIRDRTHDELDNPNTRALGHLARRLRELNAPLIVVEAPVHPVPKLLSAKRLKSYHERLSELAEIGVFTLISTDELPTMDEGDFSDMIHASPQGRARLTDFIADRLADTLLEAS
ncbi:MAG: hypothetical protein JRD03_03620 [Deltaproteobacteria bacterium]|nr:hypothetical protein [Deltaproteobacteria bacterium]